MNPIRNRLLGHTITSFKIAKSRRSIIFTLEDNSKVLLRVDGDCCSTSWIESIDDEEALLGTVLDVENIDMPNLGNIPGKHYEDVEYVSYYGLKIITNKGRSVIDYRNSSNGYYGGYLMLG